MMHEIEELDVHGLRKFGFTIGTIASILFGLALPFLFDFSWPVWPWILAAVFFFLALIRPIWLKPIYKGWMAFGGAAGWLNTRIILGFLFFIVFSPIALLLKALNKDPMSRSIRQSKESYRVPPHQRDNTHFERPY